MIIHKYEITTPLSLKEINNFENKTNIKFPSDYVSILNQFHELKLKGDLILINNKKGEELTGFESEIWGLNRFEMFNFNWDENMKDFFNFTTQEYFGIADVLYQGVLLIGNSKNNMNKIFVDLPVDNLEII